MVEVLVAGVLTVASRWLFEGGLRRRTLHAIRDELEAISRLDCSSEYAQQLQQAAGSSSIFGRLSGRYFGAVQFDQTVARCAAALHSRGCARATGLRC